MWMLTVVYLGACTFARLRPGDINCTVLQRFQLCTICSLIFKAILSLIYLTSTNIFTMINYTGFAHLVSTTSWASLNLCLRHIDALGGGVGYKCTSVHVLNPRTI